MLHRATEVFSEITAAFDSYQFYRFFQAIQNFCVVDLSNFYLDIAKDRLYISASNNERRRSCQTVMAIIVENLAKSIAPVLCHMAEDIWQYIPYPKAHESVFESGWIKLDPQWSQPALNATWQRLSDLRDGVNKILDNARGQKLIGSSLEAQVLLAVKDPAIHQELERFVSSDNSIDELRYFFLVSQVKLVPEIVGADFVGEAGGVQMGVLKAAGHKCDRCWNYAETVGTHAEHPAICDRCVSALAGDF
jgi:isoleucyl-tRNA synthetase